MFVYSIKGVTLKFMGAISLGIVLTVALLLLIPKNGEPVPDGQPSAIITEDTEKSEALDVIGNGQTEDAAEVSNEAEAVVNENSAETTADSSSEAPTETTADTEAKTEKKTYTFDKIKNDSDRRKFLEQFGWQVADDECEEVSLKIPKNFDKLINSYNEIQLRQGLDLAPYTGYDVTRYTYKITNYPSYSGEVKADVIVYRDKVIAGDICSADASGFIKDFTFPTE